MGNFINGDEWPQRQSILSFQPEDEMLTQRKFDHFDLVIGALEQDQSSAGDWMQSPNWLPGSGKTTYRRVDYYGITFTDAHTGIGRMLWVVDDSGHNGTEEMCVFYYAVKTERSWLEGLDTINFHQYASAGYKDFLAKDYTQWQRWRGSTGRPTVTIIGDGSFRRKTWFGPEGTTRENPTIGSSSGHSAPILWDAQRADPLHLGSGGLNMATSAEATQARNTFMQSFGDPSRWQGKFSKQRDLMDGIEGTVVDSHVGVYAGGPPGVGVHIDMFVHDALIEAGYTPSQIAWFRNGGVTNPLSDGEGHFTISRTNTPTAATGSQSGNASTATASKTTPPTPAVSKLIVRAPVGYTKPGEMVGEKPYIQQVGTYLDEPHKYHFRNIPNTVSYQGLGSRWVEIPRKGDFPIVEWSDWALMKVSFDFLIAHNTLDGNEGQGDGLYKDVSWDLDQLRQMAQRPLPVSIFGMDQLFAIQMKRAQTTGRAMQFVIANFTVKSARRVVGEGDKQIAAAQCSLTLQEIPIEKMRVVEMSMPPMSGPQVPGEPAEEASSPQLPSTLPGVEMGPEDQNLMNGTYR